MDYFFDVESVPEAFPALVVRVVFHKAGTLGMAFALVVEPLPGAAEFMGDLLCGDVVIRRWRCRWGRGRGGVCGTEDAGCANDGEPVPEFFRDEVCQGVEFFRSHGLKGVNTFWLKKLFFLSEAFFFRC